MLLEYWSLLFFCLASWISYRRAFGEGFLAMDSWRKAKRRTLAVINLAMIFEKADEAILPSMFKYIARDFHASPRQLGALPLCRGLAQALTSPIGGIAGVQRNG